MEQINKLLTLLAGLAVGAIVYVVVIEAKTTKDIAQISKNISVPNQALHPYNECIKLLIDQTNRFIL